MATTLREKLPYTYELIDLIQDRNNSNAMFKDFEERIQNDPSGQNQFEYCKRWETVFQKLDKNAWHHLKKKSQNKLLKEGPKGERQIDRAFRPLISSLNEAKGYLYLAGEGCSDIKFIPESKAEGNKTPDLQGYLGKRLVLCEVKTIHQSDDEIERAQQGQVINVQTELPDEFLDTKFQSVINNAKEQIEGFIKNSNKNCLRRIIFIIPNFDDLFAEYKTNYFAQMDRYLAKNPETDFEIVLFNQWTTFHTKISMNNATIVNEDF